MTLAEILKSQLATQFTTENNCWDVFGEFLSLGACVEMFATIRAGKDSGKNQLYSHVTQSI